ncbi:MAG: oligosaccharide flippase family protein [Acholeplasmatales bacterium]|nr:oligosaccharide flippase family protein [Acholeplasmatales bacterium]
MNQQEIQAEEELNIEESIVSADSVDIEKGKNDTVDKKAFFKNVIVVLISNIISVLSGVLVGFIVPKMLGVTEYGYYKTFTLYSSYIGILHFGFIDGIYLKFAGKKYEDLDKNKFRTYTRFLFLMELIVSLLVLSFSFVFIGTNYFTLILFVALNVFATNIITYFEFISQVTMKFKRITIRNVIRCSFNIISVLFLYFLYRFNDVEIYNTIYVVIVLSITYILAIWYAFTYRELIFGKANKFKEERKELLYFFKVGIPLLMANLIGQLVFVVDQQFVNILFDNDTYSTYAFAYTLINLVTIATSAISVVLYPTLRNMNDESITKNYSNINSYLLIFVSLCLIAYFPLDVIVRHFLPNYSQSLDVLIIIIPGVLISSSISVIKYNCYKTFNKILNYFFKSLAILIIAILADLIVYFIFKNTASISIVSIAVLIVWYLLVEMYFVRVYKVGWIKNFIYLLLTIAGFYGATFVPNIYLAGVTYLAYFLVITVALYFRLLQSILVKVKNRG